MPDRSKAPEFKIPEEVQLLQARKKELSNGIPLFYIKGGDQEVTRIEFLFPAGIRQKGRPLLAGISNALITDGTASLSADEIAEKLDFYGAFFQTELTRDDASLVLYSLNKYLPDILPLVREIIENARYPEDDVKVYCKNKKRKLEVNLGKVNYLARREFRKIIFGKDHPYGISPDPEDFDRVKRDDVLDFHNNHYNLGNCTVIASGMVDEKVIDLLDRNIGGVRAEKKEIEIVDGTFKTSAEKKHFIEKENALQCAIRIGRPLFNKTHSDFKGMLVLNAVLGGYFSSRLMRNIREDKGYTYGIGSSIASHKSGGYFFITTEVGADVYQKALDEIYSEINELRTNPIPEDELETVRNYLAGNFLKSVDGPFALANRFKGIYRYGLGYDFYSGLLQTIRTVQPEELMELSRKYLNRDELIELVVGES